MADDAAPGRVGGARCGTVEVPPELVHAVEREHLVLGKAATGGDAADLVGEVGTQPADCGPEVRRREEGIDHVVGITPIGAGDLAAPRRELTLDHAAQRGAVDEPALERISDDVDDVHAHIIAAGAGAVVGAGATTTGVEGFGRGKAMPAARHPMQTPTMHTARQ